MRATYAVWELTLACNLGCVHCGSRAAEARPHELTTDEALDLVTQLAEVGIREVTLIGGEAFLRRDYLDIVRAIVRAGMTCTMTTGAYGISAGAARKMKDAGLAQVSVSVDGLEATHDYLRGRTGSWQACQHAWRHLRAAGMPITCNTQINRLTAPELPRLYDVLREAGVRAWQVQLTVPMGRAADNWRLLLQPCELLDLYPMLAALARQGMRDGLPLFAGNNVGYYGPFERLLRGGGEWTFWTGCGAGLTTLGIEADGAIKGCPSLPTSAYVGGHIRQRRLADIVSTSPELRFNVDGGRADLWGFCRTCEHAEVCRGGCSWTAHVFFGRRGNNPYCHHRALEQSKRGVRERVIRRAPAPGVPFDHGDFTIIEEQMDAPWPADDTGRFSAR